MTPRGDVSGDGEGIALAHDDGLDDGLERGRMDALGFAEPATNADGRATADYGEGHDDDWDEPVPLTGTTSLPAFPVDAYPPVLADFVDGLATATQTPVDMAAVTVLGALAAAAGGRAVVEARPGWREPTNLYLAVAMAVGNRKTHVVRATTEPLYQGELDGIEKMRITVAEEKAQRQIADQRAVEAQRAAARADDDQLDALTQAAIDAAVMAESITVSEMPRLLADDATPEALGTLMAEQDGRLAVISAEGGIFDAIAGRYSPIPYLDVYLKGHAGDHLRVDRKGRSPEIIDRPALTICVAFQPGILPQIADRQSFRARGLLARFLYSVPHSFVGRRHVGAHPLDAELARRYEDHVKALVVSLAEWTDPQVLNFDLDADTELLEYERALEPRLGPDGDLGPIADWASKLAGAIVRIAGLLHLATHLADGYRTPIDGATFEAAARIGDYFLAHAIAAFRIMGADPAARDAQALMDWISRTDRTSFSKRDAHYDNRSRFPKAADLDPPLRLLVDHGYIRPRELGEGRPRGGRPPSPVYDVNPKTAPC